ncbi:Golgin subfamily A member 7/ERF4 family-domain-containing protein [Biscogniauxia sp. FL1348]|nr:Golgin subfamily A member 7/ERF4 family-domain-containing protein [Biscogniauxia sp. FL1348]
MVSLVPANLEAHLHPPHLSPHPLNECECSAWQPLKLPLTPLLECPGYYQGTATCDWPNPAPGRCPLGRLDGPFTTVAPTASHARNEPSNLSPAALDAPALTHLLSPSQQPDHPTPDRPQPQAQRAQRVPGAGPGAGPGPGLERNLLTARSRAPHDPNDYLPPPPFRNRAGSNANPQYSLPRRIGTVGRLWNPTNSTPRPLPAPSTRQPRRPRRRRPSTPPPPPVPVPVAHPTIDISEPTDPIGTGAGDYPLLALPDKRQGRHSPHSASTRASLQIEGRTSGDRRISLPSSVRHSYDAKRTSNPPLQEEAEAGPSKARLKDDPPSTSVGRRRGQSVVQRARALSFGLVNLDNSPKRSEKGKGKAIMSPSTQDEAERGFSKDLERGDVLAAGHNASNLSLPGGGPSIISSSNSSIMGDPDQPDMGEEWGPQHPCFPHMNPHVPMSSPEYKTTRIIRVRRDWLIEGDVAPTFSNLYPEILDPAGVSEQEFRRIIEKLNSELIPIFDPYYWRNILDGILGLLTGWIWDDLGFSNAKSRLRNLENWIDQWNAEKEKTVGAEDGSLAPRIVSLRRTGYMNLDIQIPDPEVRVAASEPGSRSGPSLHLEPEPVALNDAPNGS